MSNTTPLPIVKKCARCGGTHDEMFPDVYCWEETFRMIYGSNFCKAMENDKELIAIYNRIQQRYENNKEQIE